MYETTYITILLPYRCMKLYITILDYYNYTNYLSCGINKLVKQKNQGRFAALALFLFFSFFILCGKRGFKLSFITMYDTDENKD